VEEVAILPVFLMIGSSAIVLSFLAPLQFHIS